MITENLSTLKIHKLTQKQYDREKEAGNIDTNALYLTPDEKVDLSGYATTEYVDSKIGDQPVADQISSAVSTIDASKWDYVKASCKDYDDLDSVLQNLDALKAYKTIIDLTITSGGELNTDMTAKNGKNTCGSFLGIPYLYAKVDRQYRGVKLICLEDNSLWNYIDSAYGGKDITKLSENTNIVHSWDGTTLTVTSASGTSSADLKGEKGDTGAIGPTGAPGYTPVKGADYWTEEDKAEINADNIEFISSELAKRGQLKPEFANSIEECTDTSKLYVLPDGYIYAYTSHQEEVFTDILAEVGYTENSRINSSGVVKDWDNSDVTGYIPVTAGDVIRLKDVYIPNVYAATGDSYGQTVYSYTADKTYIGQVVLCFRDDGTNSAFDTVVENGSVTQFTVAPSLLGENVAYIIIGAADITSESEIYVNSTMIEIQGWGNTGLTFVSSDYGEQIADHETRLKLLEANEDGTGVPEYWLNEIETKTKSIQLAMETAGRNKSSFLWYTDAHWTSSSKISPYLLDYLCKNTPINKVNFGGDIIGDPTEFTHENIKYAYEWRKFVSDLPNHHSVYGNHDVNHRTTDVSNMAYALLLASEETAEMVVGGDCCYYIDNQAEKTRYLYLNYLTNNQNEMLAQGQFIVDAISTVKEGWHIVAIAHRWFQYTSSSAPTVGSVPRYESEILQIFDEYNARTTHTASNYFEVQNFKDGKGKVEFCIGGHIHVDYDFETEGGIPVILTASDTNQERSSAETEDCGTLGTTTESAVFGIIADYNNNKINVIGVGRGTSREISY